MTRFTFYFDKIITRCNTYYYKIHDVDNFKALVDNYECSITINEKARYINVFVKL